MKSKRLLNYINKTPELLSLLYDMDLLPEQCPEGSQDRDRMVMLAVVWRHKFARQTLPPQLKRPKS